MNSFVIDEIKKYAFLINKGLKPAANLPIQERYADEAAKFVVSLGLSSLIEPLSEGWVQLWLFKYNHMLDVIKELPQAPKSTYDHWILGKVFGYTEESISEFLERVNEPS